MIQIVNTKSFTRFDFGRNLTIGWRWRELLVPRVSDPRIAYLQRAISEADALAKFILPDERILLIEDTAEIQLAQSNLVHFEEDMRLLRDDLT